MVQMFEQSKPPAENRGEAPRVRRGGQAAEARLDRGEPRDLREYLTGWKAYFQLAATPKVFARLDQWIRRRLRAYRLKQWKRGRTAYRKPRELAGC